MKIGNCIRKSLFTGALALGLAPALYAQTLTDIGTTAPTPGSLDISQLSTAGNANSYGGINYYWDNGINNGAYPGESFTTGSAAGGYTLTSLAIKTAGLGNGGDNYTNSQSFVLNIYQLGPQGASSILIQSYTASGTLVKDGDWFQWTGLTNPTVVLAPNTTYAFGFGKASTAVSGWENLSTATNNLYAGGQIGLFRANGAVSYSTISGLDASFDIGLSAGTGTPTIPVGWKPNAKATVNEGEVLWTVWGGLAIGPGTGGGQNNFAEIQPMLNGTGEAVYGLPTASFLTNIVDGPNNDQTGSYFGGSEATPALGMIDTFVGVFIPPVTTNYTFFICSDDYSQFYLSTDITEANEKIVCEETSWSNPNSWTVSGGGSTLSQKRSDEFVPAGAITPQYPNGVPSTPVTQSPQYPNGIPMIAGYMYFFTLVHENGNGGYNDSVTYKFAGAPDPVNGSDSTTAWTGDTIMTNSVLAYVVQPPTAVNITITPLAQTNYGDGEVSFSASYTSDETPYSPQTQWQKNGVNITNADGTLATGLLYTTVVTTNDTGSKFQFVVSYTNFGLSYTSAPAAITVLSGSVVTGGLRRDVWFNQGGGLPAIMAGSLPAPTYTSTVTNFVGPVNDSFDNFVDRFSGWFIPPTTGKYVFFLTSGATNSDLFISTDSTQDNKRLIAQEENSATNLEWVTDENGTVATSWPAWGPVSQKRSDQFSPDGGTTYPYSSGISLTAGQMYYIEADRAQTSGDDDVAATFKLVAQPDPTNGQPTAFVGGTLAFEAGITATNLTISQNLVNTLAFQGNTASFTFVIGGNTTIQPQFQWIVNGTNVPGGVDTNMNASLFTFPDTTLADSGTTVQVIASVPFAGLSVTSALVTLTVEKAVQVNGEFLYQFWDSQSSVASVEAGTAGSPLYTSTVAAFQSPVNDGIDNYVDTITGYFVPPVPGTNSYVFNISSDDQSDLWLSTDNTAAHARIIAQEANWSNEGEWVTDEGGSSATANLSQKESDLWVPAGGSVAPFAGGIPLIGGQSYYIQAVHYQGGGGTQIGCYFWIQNTNSGPYAGPPADYVASDFDPTNFYMYAPPAHVFITNNPLPAVASALSGTTTNFTVSAGSDSAYFVNALDLTNVLFQWYINGVSIAGATNSTFTTPVLTTNMNISGTNASVVCSVGAIGAAWTNTAPAYLTVTEDTVPPTIVSVYGEFDSGGGGAGLGASNQYVDVVFSKPMSLASITNPANYTITGYTVTNVVFFTNQAGAAVPNEVVLQLSAPITGSFTLKANVVDVSDVAPVVTSVSSTEDPLSSMDISFNDIQSPGSTYYEGNGDYIVKGSGNDIWGGADGFRYVYEQRTNSFDVSVQVAALLGADTWTKAGLMARESIDPADGGSRMLYNVTTPQTGTPIQDGNAPQNQIATGARSAVDGSAFTPANQIGTVPNPVFPNVYLRMTRVTDLDKGGTNDVFTAYFSTNNVNWEFIASFDPTTLGSDTNFPSATYIGMCTTAHDSTAGYFGIATYQGFGDYAVHVFLTNSPESVTVHSGDTATFMVEAGADSTINTGPSLQFQWYTNGTAVPGANASTLALNLVTTNLSGTKVYCSITPIASSSVTNSATATLTVLANTEAPSVTGLYAEADSGTGNAYIDLTFNESMNTASLLNLANYTLTGATITNVELFTNNQGIGSTNEVVLRLNKPLTNSFTLGLNNILSFSGVTAGANKQVSGSVDPMTSIDIAASEVWTNGSTFELGAGNYEVDASGNDIWGNNDGFRFVYQPLTNSFDVAVQVTSLLAADAWSKAGLMARETIDPTDGGSRMFYNVTTAEIGETTLDGGTPVNVISIGARSSTDGGAFGPANATNTYNPVYPNVWLRLTRVTSSTAGVTNDLFSAYYSNDNATWQFAGSFDPTALGASNAFPSVVYVGMATTAHVGSTDAGDLATAFYANYGPTATNNIPTKVTVTAAYVAASKSLTISWAPAGGVLMESPVLGPSAVWTAVTPASNPVTVPITGTAMYFKVE